MDERDTQPMHPTLKARVLGLARQYREERSALEREARALVLCGPDCAAVVERFRGEHCHTYWDMLRSWEALDYGWQLQQTQRQAEDIATMDVSGHLRRAGVGDVHIQGMSRIDLGRPAVVAVRKWLNQPRPVEGGHMGGMPSPWLALMGSTDAGKTQAAVAVLSHFIRRHPWNSGAGGGRDVGLRPFLLVHGSELASTARHLRDFGVSGPAREREEEMRRAKVLVLDDVGAEKMDADALGLLHSVADDRYRNRRVTVWTANLNAKDFEARVDFAGSGRGEDGASGRIWRRIKEIGAVVQLGRSAQMMMGGKEIGLGDVPVTAGRR